MAVLTPEENKVVHLLRRTHFTAAEADVSKYKDKGLDNIIDSLMESENQPTIPKVEPKKDLPVLQVWWMNVMKTTTSPFLEIMTLFWHGHFTSSNYKVNNVFYMAKQNELIRKHAFGNFGDFLFAISIDPAMLIWLDNNNSTKKAPNENYARELMELFTLGIGNYTETDIREIARAITGWHVDKESGEVSFHEKQHDSGVKTIFGKTGSYDLKGVIDLILEKPECALFITRKLWEFLVYPNPSVQTLTPYAEYFREKNYEIKLLVKKILLSAEFYSEQAVRSIVKSPVELMVELMRLFPEINLKENQYVYAMNSMGQVLFNPPDVSGWHGGTAWLYSAMIFARLNFIKEMTRQVDPSFFSPISKNPEEAVQGILAKLGLMDISSATRDVLLEYAQNKGSKWENVLHELVQLALLSPEAQLK